MLFVVMAGVIVGSFVWPPPQAIIGDTSRIFFFHVPQAWICVLAFAMSMIYSIRYLRSRRMADDDRAVEAARLGFVFCLLATITGSFFANAVWGTYWNWDPRQTSIFLLLLIYAAYFALRGAVPLEERRAALSAVYAILAFLTVPFLVFVLPRIVPSLHPNDSVVDKDLSFTMGPKVRMIFFSSLAAFTVVYLWIFNLVVRYNDLKRSSEDEE